MDEISPQLDTWLRDSDPAAAYQYLRDIVCAPADEWEPVRERMYREGWVKKLLDAQASIGQWAGVYSPKWTSTTYTLLLLVDLGLPAKHPVGVASATALLNQGLYNDGGINFFKSWKRSETCVTGIILNLVSSMQVEHSDSIESLVNYLISHQMADGGWNCMLECGATHSSFNTTIIVLEALMAWRNAYPDSKLASSVRNAEKKGQEYFLVHRLYCSAKTGNVVDKSFAGAVFPPRWHHDMLRGLEYFAKSGAKPDDRLNDAIDRLNGMRIAKHHGAWPAGKQWAGREHFPRGAGPSPFNTIRALRVLKWWEEARETDGESAKKRRIV